MRKKWTDREDRFLRDNLDSMTDQEIADHLGRTYGSVMSYRRRNNIEKFEGRKYKPWSQQEEQAIRDLWPQAPLEQVHDAIPGRSYNSIKEKAIELGVSRDPKFSRAARFTPGRVYCHDERGVVTIVDTGGREYCVLNDSGTEILYHRVLWERQNGPIPEDHVLRCRSEDTTNPDPENWELVSKSEHSLRNLTNEEGQVPAQALTDGFVLGQLTKGKPELRALIKAERPELIAVAKANIKLNRQIYGSNQKQQPAEQT